MTTQTQAPTIKGQGSVRYGSSSYPLDIAVDGPIVSPELLKALGRQVRRHLGNHGDATAITSVTLTIDGQAFSVSFSADVVKGSELRYI